MKYTQKQLDGILESHSLWLKDEGGVQADLYGADLTRATLAGANLTEADLTWAKLTKAKLTKADLTWAKLTKADLTWAKLTKADLTWAKLTKAKLTKAKLTKANLTGANLSKADLYEANLTNARLNNSVWHEVQGLSAPIWNFQAGRHLAVVTRETLSIGCHTHPWAVWLTDFARIGAEAEYTPEEIERYSQLISVFNNLIHSGV